MEVSMSPLLALSPDAAVRLLQAVGLLLALFGVVPLVIEGILSAVWRFMLLRKVGGGDAIPERAGPVIVER